MNLALGQRGLAEGRGKVAVFGFVMQIKKVGL